MPSSSTIDAYFDQLAATIRTSPVVAATKMTYEKGDPTRGYVRGTLSLVDGSLLHFCEYIHMSVTAERLAYAYQYVEPGGRLLFRHDNADHYPTLTNAPHHKHAGAEDAVIPSVAPALADVLAEVELMVRI